MPVWQVRLRYNQPSMDYQTLFIANLVSLIIYTIAIAALALSNRKLIGLRWFSLALILWALRTCIESLRGHAPLPITIPLCTYGANAVNSLVHLSMFLGFRWFLVRKSPRSALVPTLVLLSMTLYPSQILFGLWTRVPVGTLPVLIAGFAAVHLLLTRARQEFIAAARVTAFFVALFLAFTGNGAIVITHNIALKGTQVGAWPDPRVQVTMLVLMTLDSCFVASFVWFYVVELQSKLRVQARTDNLTGALNGGALDVEAEREIARCRRHNITLSVIVLDIDFFKHLNDARGHDAGDLALRSLVTLLIAELRLQDLVARTGGEEFILLLPQTGLVAARAVAERIRIRIEKSCFDYHDGLPICITTSLGVAELYPAPNDTWEAMRRRGDLAMYKAKRLGRNRVIVQAEPSTILLHERTGLSPPSRLEVLSVAGRQRLSAALRHRPTSLQGPHRNWRASLPGCSTVSPRSVGPFCKSPQAIIGYVTDVIPIGRTLSSRLGFYRGESVPCLRMMVLCSRIDHGIATISISTSPARSRPWLPLRPGTLRRSSLRS
jgi:diguanylate cyclase (GGDEF)-like protein